MILIKTVLQGKIVYGKKAPNADDGRILGRRG